MIFRPVMWSSRHSRGRANADDGYRAIRSLDRVLREAMIMAMKHKFRAFLAQEVRHARCIVQAPSESGRAGQWRVVDHHHTKQAFLTTAPQHARESCSLGGSNMAGRHEWQCRDSGIHANQRDALANPQIGERRQHSRLPCPIIAQHMRAKLLRHCTERARHIGIMIARDHADALRPAERGEMALRQRKFRGIADIDEIPGQRNMIDGLFPDVGNERIEHHHVVNRCACAMPVQGACQPLVEEVAQGNSRQWADMGIGKMSEQEGHDLDPRPARPVGPDVSPVAAMQSRAEPRLGLWHRLFLRLAHRWFLFRRGMTLGVRVIALNAAGDVFLVRHSYVPGWHLPGGGIEIGQTARAAVAAELAEEGNLSLTEEPELCALYLNLSASRRDHVALYVARNVTQIRPRQPDHEIIEAGFFPFDRLPEETTGGTRRRLAEWQGIQPVALIW